MLWVGASCANAQSSGPQGDGYFLRLNKSGALEFAPIACSGTCQPLTIDQVANAAYSVGFRGGALVNSIAISNSESNFKLNAWCFNCVTGITEDSRGLWQINVHVHTGYDNELLLTSASYNATAAFQISNAATDANWLPWSTFSQVSSIDFTNHLDAARVAAQNVDSTVIRGVNDRVQAATTGANNPVVHSVNSTPGGPSLRIVSTGAQGTVLDGPVIAALSSGSYRFIWWKIHWDDGGADGWSAEDYMSRTGSEPSPKLDVTPTLGLSSSGPVGGPFNPVSTTFTVKNIGGGTLNWSISASRNWTSLSKSSGALAANATEPVTVSINSSANSLTADDVSVLSFTNNNNNDGNTLRGVTLSVTTCNYSISPTSISPTADPVGGTVSVTTQSGCGWTATNNDNWITIVNNGSGTGSGFTTYSVDANPGPSARSGTATIAGKTFTVNQAAPPPSLTLVATPSGATQVGQSYSQTNVASGGSPPYSYTVLAGSLPAGTALNASTGTVSGTAALAGPFSYTIKVTDSSSPAQTATQSTNGTISPVTLTLTATASGATQVSQSYSQANVASGGTTPYSYSVASGAPPPGTSLSASTGTVAGIPTAAGPFSYTIKVTDSSSPSQTATQSTSGTITSATLTLVATTSTKTQVGQSYSQTNVASGGTTPYSYSVASGAPPPGTSLNTTTGTVSGTPTAPGPVSYTIKVTDSSNPAQTATQSTSGTIAPATTPTVTGVSPSSGPMAGGTVVTIAGTNFTGVTAVEFGDTLAEDFTVNSATSITATTPTHVAGVVDITVTTTAGSGTGRNLFAYSSEFQINTTTAGNQQGSSLAGLNDGGFVAVWSSDQQDGSGFGVFGQRYSVAGDPIGGEFQVNTYTTGDQRDARIAGLNDGGFVVTWTSTGQDGFERGIFGQRYDGGGSPIGSEFQINSTVAGDQTSSFVAGLSGGGFVVTWTSPDVSSTGIYGQRFTANGKRKGKEIRINRYSNDRQQRSSVAALDDGGFIVTWMSNGQDGSSFGIYGRRYTLTGKPIGGNFKINSYTPSDQDKPSVAALRDGGYVAVWESADEDTSLHGVYAQRYAMSGLRSGREFRINNQTKGEQQSGYVASLADGGFVVVWTSPEKRGTSLEIFGRRYDAHRKPTGPQFQVNTYTDGTQQFPRAIGLKDGSFVVTWTSEGQDGSLNGVFGRKFGP
jgi:hypothetical protein